MENVHHVMTTAKASSLLIKELHWMGVSVMLHGCISCGLHLLVNPQEGQAKHLKACDGVAATLQAQIKAGASKALSRWAPKNHANPQRERISCGCISIMPAIADPCPRQYPLAFSNLHFVLCRLQGMEDAKCSALAAFSRKT